MYKRQPVTRPVWDSNLGPPAYGSGSLITELSAQFKDAKELVRMELSCVVLWRPETLDCTVPIPPEALELAYP